MLPTKHSYCNFCLCSCSTAVIRILRPKQNPEDFSEACRSANTRANGMRYSAKDNSPSCCCVNALEAMRPLIHASLSCRLQSTQRLTKFYVLCQFVPNKHCCSKSQQKYLQLRSPRPWSAMDSAGAFERN